jgi:hypothetical protein
VADHPVKVPPELFTEWLNEAMAKTSLNARPGTVAAIMADKAAQWGADQELEACCEYLQSEIGPLEAAHFRAAMRPKPPSLAEQGLKALGPSVGLKHFRTLSVAEQDDIRAALNRLKELEAQQ